MQAKHTPGIYQKSLGFFQGSDFSSVRNVSQSLGQKNVRLQYQQDCLETRLRRVELGIGQIDHQPVSVGELEVKPRPHVKQSDNA
jgi:hypothetical protein